VQAGGKDDMSAVVLEVFQQEKSDPGLFARAVERVRIALDDDEPAKVDS